MKKGPDRWRSEPRVLRAAKRYCLVCEASVDDDGWLAEAEEAGWFAEAVEAGWLAEADDWLAAAEEAGWLAEAVDAGWFVEAVGAGALAEAELAGWLAEAEVLPEASFRPATCTPAAFAWSMAACVRGPLMPSTGPGSKPLSLSACCSSFTFESPCACEPELMLLSADALDDGWFAEAEVVADWLAEAEADGWFAEVEVDGWFADAVAAGWLVDAEVCLSLSLPAITVPAAMRAATRASFLNMVKVLSDGQLTAVRFGPRGAAKLHAGGAPGGARHSGTRRGGCAT